MNQETARDVARWGMAFLHNHTNRISSVGPILGSWKDHYEIEVIDLLCTGKVHQVQQSSLFDQGKIVRKFNALETWIKYQPITPRGKRVDGWNIVGERMGENYHKAMALHQVRLDYVNRGCVWHFNLWVVEAEEFGVAQALLNSEPGIGDRIIRFAKRKLKSISNLRLHNHYGKCKQGKACNLIIPTPSEKILFRELELEYLPVEDRTWKKMIAVEKKSLGLSEAARWK